MKERKTFKCQLATGIMFWRLAVLSIATVCVWAMTVEAKGGIHRKHGPYGENGLVRHEGKEELRSPVLEKAPYGGAGRDMLGVKKDEERKEADVGGKSVVKGKVGVGERRTQRRLGKVEGAASDEVNDGADKVEKKPGAVVKKETQDESINGGESDVQDEDSPATGAGGQKAGDDDDAQAKEREKLDEEEWRAQATGDEGREGKEKEGVEDGAKDKAEDGAEEKEEEGLEADEDEGTTKEAEGTEEKGEEGVEAKEEDGKEDDDDDDEEEEKQEAAAEEEEEKEAEKEEGQDHSLHPTRDRHRTSRLRSVTSGRVKVGAGEGTGKEEGNGTEVGEEASGDKQQGKEMEGEEGRLETAVKEKGEVAENEEADKRQGHSLHRKHYLRRSSQISSSRNGRSTEYSDRSQVGEHLVAEGREDEGEGVDDGEEKAEGGSSLGSAVNGGSGAEPPPSSPGEGVEHTADIADAGSKQLAVNTQSVDGVSGSNVSSETGGVGGQLAEKEQAQEDTGSPHVEQENGQAVGGRQEEEDGEAQAALDVDKKIEKEGGEEGSKEGELSFGREAEQRPDASSGNQTISDDGSDELDDEDEQELFQPVQQTFSGLNQKTRTSVVPKLGSAKKLGLEVFEHAHSSLKEGLQPILGKNYSPIVSTLITYGMLLVPLIVTVFMFERVRAVLSIQKLLFFANAYLTAYSITLLCLAIVIGAEPMATLQNSAWENYFLLQLFQALGYIMYLLLQLTNVITVFNTDTTLAKVISIIQFVTAGAVGLHYYVAVWQKAMVDKPPRITSTAYLVYALIFFVLCQMARLRNTRRDAILASGGSDKAL